MTSMRARTERAKIADLHSVEVTDQLGCEPVAEQCMPRKSAARARTCEPRTNGYVCVAFGNWSEKQGKLGRPIAVVAVEKTTISGAFALAIPVKHACP